MIPSYNNISASQKLDKILSNLIPEKSNELQEILNQELQRSWLPTPGPQLDAFLSKADLLLYGGAAGGGKTDLLCGLALTSHFRTVIFRRQSNDLNGFWDRLNEICTDPVSRNSVLKKMATKDGRFLECGHLESPDSEKTWQGRPHDLIGFDEGAQLNPFKVNFVMGWNRSAQGHRCRAVITTNPPIRGEGAYLIEWFAPWLDPLFKNPALSGELRWAIMIGDETSLKTIWVDGPDPIILDKDKNFRKATEEEVKHDPPIQDLYKPLSRTFIPAKLDDNPYLRNTNYRAQLNSMPEPLRSQLLFGDFLAAGDDHEWQVIPSEWVKAAQARWKNPIETKMISIGVDVAQGGKDFSVIACLHENNVFGELIRKPGIETPDGPSLANLILKYRRDVCPIAIDMGGGFGGSPKDHLKTQHDIEAIGIIYGSSVAGCDPSTNLEYMNLRAKMYWEFRNALDPSKGLKVALPPGDRLFSQLTATRWQISGKKIKMELKEDVKERLGSSPDDADAIIEAWHIRDQGTSKTLKNLFEVQSKNNHNYGWMRR